MIEKSIIEYADDLGWFIKKAGSFPVEQIDHNDRSESYSWDELWLWKLDNSQYAVVHEAHCSCGSFQDSSVDVYTNEQDARERYLEIKKEQCKYD